MRSFFLYIIVYTLCSRSLFFHEKSPAASINNGRNKPHHVKNIIIIVYGKGLTVTFRRSVCVCVIYNNMQLMYYRVISAPDGILYIALVCRFYLTPSESPLFSFYFFFYSDNYYDYYYNILLYLRWVRYHNWWPNESVRAWPTADGYVSFRSASFRKRLLDRFSRFSYTKCLRHFTQPCCTNCVMSVCNK